ncbi:hypothetical protein BX616_006492 [Lobosporangium transversale]|eukprot:XP_021876431.1 hypothetical protein BCR41DRAFT_328517 [Lobosporangium transversale]
MSTFDGKAPMKYMPDTVESLSLFFSLSCITLMSALFGRKTAGTQFSNINYARGLVVSLYLVSWLFSIMAAMLVQTNNFNLLSCQMSIFICIILYGSCKLVIYLFLIERVHIVTAVGIRRWNCPMFKFNMFLLTPYAVVFVLAVLFRVAVITDEGECQIGLQGAAAIPYIIYDVLLSCWLTALFLRSLVSSTSMLQGPTKSKLRDVARRTLIGSVFALILSCANISTLVYFQGTERGLFCLASCTLDVTLNAITIHWVTSSGKSKRYARVGGGYRGGSSSNGEQRLSRVGAQFAMPGFGAYRKDLSPRDSHISVSIESYVEEYHQMHIASKVQPPEPARYE